MNNQIKVADKIFWIGVNDRRKNLFENIWPLPNGVSYNSYLINDQKTALLDTIEMGVDGAYLKWIDAILDGKDLDYLIINHMEPDHSGEIGDIVRKYPNVKIVGNSKTFKILEAYYGFTENLHEVKDGDTLDLGTHKLQFVLTPWVHWPETMMTYDMTVKALFSADAFGTFGTLDGNVFDDEICFEDYEDEMRRYYSNIVGKYSSMVQKAFAKLSGITIDIICPLHGPIWRENPAKVVGLYDKWSKLKADPGVVIIYASMYGNTGQIADHIARQCAEAGIRRIKVFDVSKTHISYLISEMWKYQGVILGSCAYNGEMFPLMENLTKELLHIGLKNRYLGIFGSYSWNGGGVRKLSDFACQSCWEIVAEPVDVYGVLTPEKYSQCQTIAVSMAAKLTDK